MVPANVQNFQLFKKSLPSPFIVSNPLSKEIKPVKIMIIKAYRRLADHSQCPPSRLIIRFKIKVILKKRPDKRPIEINEIIFCYFILGFFWRIKMTHLTHISKLYRSQILFFFLQDNLIIW